MWSLGCETPRFARDCAQHWACLTQLVADTVHSTNTTTTMQRFALSLARASSLCLAQFPSALTQRSVVRSILSSDREQSGSESSLITLLFFPLPVFLAARKSFFFLTDVVLHLYPASSCNVFVADWPSENHVFVSHTTCIVVLVGRMNESSSFITGNLQQHCYIRIDYHKSPDVLSLSLPLPPPPPPPPPPPHPHLSLLRPLTIVSDACIYSSAHRADTNCTRTLYKLASTFPPLLSPY